MKQLYIIVDDIAQEESYCFFANNIKQAKVVANHFVQQSPGDMEFSMYCIGSSFLDDTKEFNNLGFEKDFDNFAERIWSFPSNEQVSEEELKYKTSSEVAKIEINESKDE